MTDQPRPDEILLSIPATAPNLRIARLAASSLAADLGFDLEATEDLRVAVTELASALITSPAGPTDDRIELRYRAEGDAVVVEGSRRDASGEPPALDPIAAELLALTTDEHSLGFDDGGWAFSVRKGAALSS